MKKNYSESNYEKMGPTRTDRHHCMALSEYVMRETQAGGYAMIEILHRGGPIHIFDSHFQFGVRKAMILMACMDSITELVSWPRGVPFHIEISFVEVDGLAIKIEAFQEFEKSNGRRIKVPYLRISWTSGARRKQIGIGREKGKALCALEPQIRQWIEKNTN